jgi:flagellar motor protein MotB
MKKGILFISVLMPLACAQQSEQRANTAPIYHVTVVERTVKAVNYQYLSEPTRIDFRGTVLLPHAKGEASVESRQGRTEIDAKVEGLIAPQRFGGEYLSYVLWAVTPEGRPHNIGELIPDSADKARIRVTTDLQSFALVVTAEPHSAVRQPSDVVVLENEIRPDTVGIIKPVEAKYELLPRGEYTLHLTDQPGAAQINTPKVSMHEYQAVSELFQAQNAVGLAEQANAERYAPDTLARAKRLLTDAQQLHGSKADFRQVVQSAREAAQTAEDARAIAKASEHSEQLRTANLEQTRLQAQLATALQEKERALRNEQDAKAQADAARAQAQVALDARNQAESEASSARVQASEAQSEIESFSAKAAHDQQKMDVTRRREFRIGLLDKLNRCLPTLDTGRGLVATVPDDGFGGGEIRGPVFDQLARVAAVLSANPGLHVSVEGYSDNASKEPLSRERADAVRRVLVANGLAGNAVSASGLGDSRPLGPNSTPRGRIANSRVEIVIAGESIGELPLWERPATLTSSRQESRQ